MTSRVAAWGLAVFLCSGSVFAAPLVEGPESSGPAAEIPAAPPQLPPSAAQIALPPTTPAPVETADIAAPAATAPSTTAKAREAETSSPLPTARAAQTLGIAAPSALFDGLRAPAWFAVETGPAPVAGQLARQSAARVKLMALRAATFPAHLWPFTRLINKFSHGEALAGLTPGSAVDAARGIEAEHRTGAVIGRLSWELHDVWSVRGAARSYARLIDAVAAAKKRDPKFDAAVSLDVEALGAQLDGVSLEEKTRIAKANAINLARRARDAGVRVEFDIGALAPMPLLLDVTRDVVRELRMPVRLALAARYLASEAALRDWAALARETDLKLGVRLVKGSFIEGDQLDTLYLRRPLLDQYKKLVTQALSLSGALDVAVATHNEEIWKHAQAESRRLKAGYTLQTIRGVNPELQARMRAAGNVPREYVSYGVDTPVMALMEAWTNWRQKRALRRRFDSELD